MAFYIGEILKLRGEFLEAHQKGDYLESIVLGKKIIELYKNNDDCDSMEYALDLHNLGIAYDDICMYDKAIFYYRISAELKKKLSGESIAYADTLNNLAIAYSNIGQHEKALKLQEKVLSIRDALQGKDHTDYTIGLFNLGNAYEDIGDYTKSLEMHTKALIKANRQKDFSKADYADILVSMGRVYEKIGNYHKSLDSYEKAIGIIRELGDMELYRMTLLLSAAAAAEKAERLNDAKDWCKEAIDIRKKMMPVCHLDYISNMNVLATIYAKRKEYQNAKAVHEEILELSGKILGKSHVYYGDIINNIGVDYCGMKQYEESLQYHRQALQLKKAAVGKVHHQYALSLVSMGAVFLRMEQYENALSCYREALEIRNTIYHGDHVACADVLMAIANVYQKKKDYENAIKYYSDAKLLRNRLNDTKSALYIWNLQCLGKCYIYANKRQEGIRYLQEAIEIQQNQHGTNHPDYASALRQLGAMYGTLGEYQKGIALWKEAATIEEEMLGEKSPRYWKTTIELAYFHIQQKEFTKAMEYLHKAENVSELEEPWLIEYKALSQLYLAKCYMELDEKELAWHYYQKGLKSQRKVQVTGDSKFEAEEKQFLTSYQSRKWQPSAMRTLRKNTMELERQIEPLKIVGIVTAGKNKASSISTDKLENKIELLRNAYTTLEKSRGAEDTEAVEAALALGDAYREQDRCEDALFWYQKAEKYGDEKIFAQCCLKEGTIYLQTGNYRKALEKLTNAKRYIEEYDSIHTQEYIEIITLLKELYQVQAKQKAIFFDKKEDILQHEELSKTDKKKEFVEKTSDENIEYYGKLAFSMEKEKGETLEYAKLLLKIAELYCNIKKYTESLLFFEKAADVYRRNKGEKSIAYGRILERVGEIYFILEKWKKAQKYLEKAYFISNSQGLKKFFSSKKKLAAIYWKTKQFNKLISLKMG